jgi:urease accessory protein
MKAEGPDRVLGSASRVDGGLRLVFDTGPNGDTRLRESWFCPPLHLSRAYREAGWQLHLVTSPTAGLFAGDRIAIDCRVGAHAKVSLIGPAASRVHGMQACEQAQVSQHYQVAGGAWLDAWSAPMILQQGAALDQDLRVEVDAGGAALIAEVTYPGRPAHETCFTFRHWRSRAKVFYDGTLVAFEQFLLRPGSGMEADWSAHFPGGPYASLHYLNGKPCQDCLEQLHALAIEGALIGASPFRVGGLGVKLLACDGVALRHAFLEVRRVLMAHSGVCLPGAIQRAQTFF